jgi:hypothetical protein
MSEWLQVRCQTKKWFIHPSQGDSQLGNPSGIPSRETAVWDMVYPMGYGLPKPRWKCIMLRAEWYQGIKICGAANDLLRELGDTLF